MKDYRKQLIENFKRANNVVINEDIGDLNDTNVNSDIEREFKNFDNEYLKREGKIPQVYEIPNGRFELNYEDGIEFQGADDETGQAQVFYNITYIGVYENRNVKVDLNITIVPQIKFEAGDFIIENQIFLEDITVE